MKILFLDQFSQPGGAQQCLLDLLPAVLRRGWEPHVMLPGGGSLVDRVRDLGISVTPIRCGPYASGRKTWKDFTRFGPDVVAAAAAISSRPAELIYVNGPRLIPAAVLAARNCTRVVFHCHSLLPPGYVEWAAALPLKLSGASILASSQFVAGPLKKWIPGSRIQVVYNGVPETRGSRSMDRQHLRIGIISRIAPEKGHALFLGAAHILHRALPHCQFVICGAPLFSDQSYDREIRFLARYLPVQFTGWLDDVEPVLNSLDVLVVPSAPIDATPRIIMQAFAAKVPVVAFANAGFKELIEDGRTGYLVPIRTAEALAGKVLDVLGDPGGRAEVADSAWSHWQQRYSLDAFRSHMMSILESIR